jgi:2-polyprenyl-3-methyl-5-hydroxy-6-metoxy-1,4-benzoquinol methylase
MAPAHSCIEMQERTPAGLHAALIPSVRSLGLDFNARILDLGCGTGAWLTRLHDLGYSELWGTDRDEDNFQAAGISHFISSNLDNGLRLPTSFSLVTIIEVIEHVHNPYRLVEMAANALRPGGWLLITSPNIYSIRARFRFLVRARLPAFERSSDLPVEEEHIHPLIVEAYKRRVFDRLNLSIDRVWTYPESGSHGSRLFVRLISKALRLILPDVLSGDTLCLLLRKPFSR